MTVNSRPASRSRRKGRAKLEAKAVAVLALAAVILVHPYLLEFVLCGAAVVAAVALAGLVLYMAGMARGKFKPPARIILGRHSIEFL